MHNFLQVAHLLDKREIVFKKTTHVCILRRFLRYIACFLERFLNALLGKYYFYLKYCMLFMSAFYYTVSLRIYYTRS